jgi:hypothetical protein
MMLNVREYTERERHAPVGERAHYRKRAHQVASRAHWRSRGLDSAVGPNAEGGIRSTPEGTQLGTLFEAEANEVSFNKPLRTLSATLQVPHDCEAIDEDVVSPDPRGRPFRPNSQAMDLPFRVGHPAHRLIRDRQPATPCPSRTTSPMRTIA